MDSSITILTEKNFDEFIKHSDFSVVLFGWLNCPPCKGTAEQLKPISNNLPCATVELSENPELKWEYGIKEAPTLVLFKNGAEVDRVKGYQTTSQLKEWLNL